MFKAVVVTAAENGISFYEAEKKDKITDHAKIGGYLAKKWQLPASLTDTITRHHSMDGSSNSDLIINVHTANILANAFLPKEKKPKMLSEIHPDALRKIKPTISTINDWLPQTIEEIESACEFFMEADIEK